MASFLERLSINFPFRGCLLGAAVLVVATAAISGAHAQNVAALVNGEPITALDIDQRAKLLEASSPTHKALPRQEVLTALIEQRFSWLALIQSAGR